MSPSFYRAGHKSQLWIILVRYLRVQLLAQVQQLVFHEERNIFSEFWATGWEIKN